MKVGTKSLLIGVHQIILHPIVVLIAWIYLYHLPSWKEVVCIIIHDWGYWQMPNMDGAEGEKHPELGASIAKKLFGQEYYELCLYHSRHYAKKAGKKPSKLCWADKLSIKYEPWWFYLPRAYITGELKEYRLKSPNDGGTPLPTSNREWYKSGRDSQIEQAIRQAVQ